ncbi:hemerythrin domain-containing protein [Rhodococcus sp. NPDC003348]
MSTALTTDRPDTGDMLLAHNIFRRGFGSLPELVRAVPAGDTVRARRLVAFHAEMCTGLHHHHTGEDELMWPLLLDRAPTDHALVLRMEEQHERIGELVERSRTRAARFEQTAAADDGEALAATLTALVAVLDEHLAEEETHILPLVEQTMSVAEWEKLGERGRAAIPRNRQLVFLGFMMLGAPPEQRTRLLADMPLSARLAWRLFGNRAFVKEYREIFGVDPS